MNSIYRVAVPVTDYQELKLTGQPISVAADRGGRFDHFDMWYEHMGHLELPDRYPIWVFGTGHPVPWNRFNRPSWQFLGTIITDSMLVWHVYTGPDKNGDTSP